MPIAAPGRRLIVRAAVGSLLAVHYVLAVSSTWHKSPTIDEPLHMVSGTAYWLRNDYRLQPENGNLPQRWCGIPLVLMNARLPALTADAWLRSDAFALGAQYLYETGNNPEIMLRASRAFAGVWSVALCLVIFFWSRHLFGSAGGLTSLVLAAFWPAFLAHGSLATSDVCGAVFFTVATKSIWEGLARPSPRAVGCAALATGLALVSKHSAVLLAPIALLMVGAQLLSAKPPERVRRAVALAGALAGIALGATALTWPWYGFRYAAVNLSLYGPGTLHTFESLDGVCRQSSWLGSITRRLAALQAVPEAWLYGLNHIVAIGEARSTWAIGRYSHRGWWWYFPLCFGIKNTLASLLIVALTTATGLASAASRRLPLDVAPLLLSLVVLGITAITSPINIGERHLMNFYPPLIICCGGLARLPLPRWFGSVVLPLLLAGHATESLRYFPDQLTFFNALVPRAERHRWLIDSNLDWGQNFLGILAAVTQVEKEGCKTYYAAYGHYVPAADRYYRLPAERLANPEPVDGVVLRQQLGPGRYFIGPLQLYALYSQVEGPWCRSFEDAYQHLLRNPSHESTEAFNLLQCGRLLSHLRLRHPDALVNNAVLVFDLNADDLHRFLLGAPAELDDLSFLEQLEQRSAKVASVSALRAFRAGDLESAERRARLAIGLDARYAPAHRVLGRVQEMKGDQIAAAESFEAARSLDLEQNQGPPVRGRDETRNRLYFEAIEAYRRGDSSMAIRLLNNFREAGGVVPNEINALLERRKDP